LKEIATCDIGTLDDAPLGTIEVFDQRLSSATRRSVGIAYGPDVVSGSGSYAGKKIIECFNVRTSDDRPCAAIPLLDEGLRSAWKTAFLEASHGPDVLRRNGGYGEEFAGVQSLIWAGDDTPAAAVPVFDQCFCRARRRIVSGSPDVVGGEGNDAGECTIGSRIGAGNDSPGCPIPLLDEGLGCFATIGAVEPNGPGVRGGDSSHAEKLVIRGTGVWAGDDLPYLPVPLLNQRLSSSIAHLTSYGPDVARRYRRYAPKNVAH